MKYRSMSLVLLVSVGLAQWINLDLEPRLGEGFKTQVTPLVQGLALTTTGSETRATTPNHRLAISGALVRLRSDAFQGTMPMLFGRVSAASNLTLSGSLSAFRSDRDLVFHAGYGLGIVPGTSPWQFSLHVGTLQGSRNLRLHSLQLAASYETQVARIPLQVQFGFVNTRARFSFTDVADPPTNLERRFYAFQFATQKDFAGITIVPKLIWHPNVVLLSLETRLNIY